MFAAPGERAPAAAQPVGARKEPKVWEIGPEVVPGPREWELRFVRDGFGCAARDRNEGNGAGAKPDEPLRGELRIGRDHDAARDAEVVRECARRGEPRLGRERSGADQPADLLLDLGRQPPGAIEAELQKWSCSREGKLALLAGP